MIHLNNAGSAYEIGRQHGASCPGAVRLACEAWLRVAPIEMPRAEAGIRLVKERLGRFFPECLEEVQGIADGSGQTLDRMLVLNCSDAMIGRASGVPSCSCIGFVDSDHGPLIGKTADWQVDHAQDLTTWQHYRPRRGEGYRFIHYGGAGTWWSEGGLNEAGLGMVLNGLPGAGVSPDSVPTLPLARGVLQHCAAVQESIEWLARYDVMYLGFNLMLSDRQGDLACVEVVPGAQGVQRPAGDCLIHTNHCLLPETEDVVLDEETLADYGYPGLVRNSEARYRNLESLVPEAPPTLAGMEALLRNRSSSGAISQSGEQGMHTAYAMIVAPTKGKLWGAEGFPPEVPFVEYTV